MSGKILRHYVSDIDLLLENFDKEHPEVSESQRKEIEKYHRIYFLRDTANRLESPKKLWEGF
jgi:hypothetical protein